MRPTMRERQIDDLVGHLHASERAAQPPGFSVVPLRIDFLGDGFLNTLFLALGPRVLS